MPALSQKNRLGELSTPLGEDRLVLQGCNIHEGMSELFEISIDALSEEEDVDFDDAIGVNCCIKINAPNDVKRYFNGVLAEAEWTGLQDDLYTYRLTLRPWLWVLSHTTDCRFFQDKSVPDIIKEVFDTAGFSDYKLSLNETYSPLEYCVQYRETSFAFVSRLMEEYGIYYYFKHTSDKHVLTLVDSKSSHEAIEAKGGTLSYVPLSGAYVRDFEHVQHWASERRFRSGKFSVNDYDFKKPGAALLADSNASESYAKSNMEVYDYPGRYTEHGTGETFAKVRLAAEQSSDRRRIASGMAPSMYAGGKVTLIGHNKESENIDYVIVRATHTLATQHYRSGGASSGRDDYGGSYVLQPFSKQFRAPLVTPKPLIHGIQTAKVVGEDGEEITVDKYGRIKVQFYWDRNKKQSCWIRVAEVWSGSQWGSVFHPRIGQEVVIDFLEGDPDRPLCIGTVYNGDNGVPYPLPDKKTIGGWKSNSTKGGGGYNEFIYDDEKGSEEIRMHAEKDHNVVVRHAETWKIGETFEIPKGSPSRETTILNGDDKLTVSSGDQNINIAQDQTLTIGMNQTDEVGINRSTTVGMNDSTTIGMSRSDEIGMSDSLEVGMSQSITVGMSQEVTAGMSIALTAGLTMTLTAGASSIILSPAGIVMTAPTITLLGGVTSIIGKAPMMAFAGGQVVVV